jgi:hypothetical protein
VCVLGWEWEGERECACVNGHYLCWTQGRWTLQAAPGNIQSERESRVSQGKSKKRLRERVYGSPRDLGGMTGGMAVTQCPVGGSPPDRDSLRARRRGGSSVPHQKKSPLYSKYAKLFVKTVSDTWG